ncbi:MAG: ribonuclease HII [Gemmatimonadetes bacterium]|nr:ribonuclease HII [Gemmatimonadota bacterium]
MWGRGVTWLAGVDEVGRGPLAGPVVAAAVVLPPGCQVEGAADSKTLPAATREQLYHTILAASVAVGVGAASVHEIDRLNILRATSRAMDRAVTALRRTPENIVVEHIVVDGLPIRGVDWVHEAVVGGDSLVHSIACASIVAKVLRDRLMCLLARRYPAYGWDKNMGYGTPEHLRALDEFGLSPHHRVTFREQLDLGLAIQG